MERKESVIILHENPWPPELDGLFLPRDGTVKFCFLEGRSVVAQTLEGAREVWYTEPEGGVLELPGDWANACPGYPPMLHCKRGVDHTKQVYYFGDYTVSHKSEWQLVCRRSGEEVWHFRGYAWRYTDIERYGDNIYFGTAGQGGYFYLLNLYTGVPLLKLKTGGTVNMYARRENLLYLLRQEKRAYLVCVDLNDGRILQRLELPGKACDHSPVRLIDHTVHCVTFVYNKNGSVEQALWNRVEV